MKKTIIAFLMVLCVVSGLSAVEYTVIESRDYSPVVFGANFVIAPSLYTGGKDVAQRDLMELLAIDAFPSGYNANNLEPCQENLAVGFDFYLYAALDKEKGVGLDGSYMFQEGFVSHYDATTSDAYGDLYRSFTAIELFPHYRHYFGNSTYGWTAFKIGPNIAITGDATDVKELSLDIPVHEKLQNDILYGVRAGFDAGLVLGKWLMSYDFTITYDLNKTYHSAGTGYNDVLEYICSHDLEDIGNRISFNIGIGYGLKF